jgi:hypothetical protein
VQGVSSGDPDQLLVMADRRSLPTSQTARVQWARGLARGVTVAPRCVADGIGVELDNTARTSALRAVVDKRPVTVPGGGSKVVPVQVPEGEKYSIPVSDGVKTVRLTGVRTCSSTMTPVVTAAPDCAAGGMGVTIVNEDAAREAIMSVDGKDVRVPGETTKVVRVPAAEGDPYAIDVVGQDGFSRTFSGVRDCATAQATDLKAASADTGSEVAAALPITGAALGIFLAGGAALFTIGAAIVALTRRRRA